MLSGRLKEATLYNFGNYPHHFYGSIDPSLRDQFDFEDLTAIYTKHAIFKLFVLCIKYMEGGRWIETTAKESLPLCQLH